MNDVGQDREFLTFLDVVLTPVVGQLVAGFLARHALLDPLVAAAVLLPRFARAIQRKRRVGQFLHALVACLGESKLDGFGFGAGDGLDKTQ